MRFTSCSIATFAFTLAIVAISSAFCTTRAHADGLSFVEPEYSSGRLTLVAGDGGSPAPADSCDQEPFRHRFRRPRRPCSSWR